MTQIFDTVIETGGEKAYFNLSEGKHSLKYIRTLNFS